MVTDHQGEELPKQKYVNFRQWFAEKLYKLYHFAACLCDGRQVEGMREILDFSLVNFLE